MLSYLSNLKSLKIFDKMCYSLYILLLCMYVVYVLFMIYILLHRTRICRRMDIKKPGCSFMVGNTPSNTSISHMLYLSLWYCTRIFLIKDAWAYIWANKLDEVLQTYIHLVNQFIEWIQIRIPSFSVSSIIKTSKL